MKVIDQINGSGLFAQSAFSAAAATKDSLGRDITATYLTGIDLSNYYTKDETSGSEQLAQAFSNIPGGGSVSSKYGTISVDGSNIEATNKAIEYKGAGFTSSFDDKPFYDNIPVVVTWDDYSQETSIHVSVLNESPDDLTLTYSSNTNVTGESTTAAWNTINLDVQIPNATEIQFSANHYFKLQNTRVSAVTSFKVSELAWKTDLPTYTYNSANKLSAINGSALVGNEDYLIEQGFVQNLTSPKGTISVLNNNKIEGTNSAIASDVIEGFVSAYNGLNVYPGNSATLTWANYVPNTILHVSGKQYTPNTLTYSADTGVTGQITLPDSGETSIEVPTDSTSIVIGNENWDNMNYNFTVSAADNYEIGELAWASAIPTYEYDNTNKISAINGSALAGQEVSHDNTLSGNGTFDSPLGVVPGYNETVLFETTAIYGAGVCNLSESLKNFERIGVKPTRGYSGAQNPGGAGPWNYFDTDQIVGGSTEPFQAICPFILEYVDWKISQFNPNADCTVLTWYKGFQKNMETNSFYKAKDFTECVGIQKVIGINRKV